MTASQEFAQKPRQKLHDLLDSHYENEPNELNQMDMLDLKKPKLAEVPQCMQTLSKEGMKETLLKLIGSADEHNHWKEKLQALVDSRERNGEPTAEKRKQPTLAECEADQYTSKSKEDVEKQGDGKGGNSMEVEQSGFGEDLANHVNLQSNVTFIRRARHLPMRLSDEERKLLVLLERTLKVSEYTDNVDVLHARGARREAMMRELGQVCSILSGLKVASAVEKGTKFVKNMSRLEENEEFFQQVFEIGRRYKMLNPERMRDTYGKLMYLLMDSVRPDMNLSCRLASEEVVTVAGFIKEKAEDDPEKLKSAAEMLKDPLMSLAVSGFEDISQLRWAERKLSGPSKKQKLQEAGLRKRDALSMIKEKYSSEGTEGIESQGVGGVEKRRAPPRVFSSSDIERIVNSFRDEDCFNSANKECVDSMLGYLERYFDPESERILGVPDKLTSLTIRAGVEGSRLTSHHMKQYKYVEQSLTLWKNVLQDLFKIWHCVDKDLLLGKTYRLMDTGQGLQRVSDAPKTYDTISSVLQKVQKKLKGWQGSSVIHMGDHNVPNALVFIDKYTQIPRILGPIAHTLDRLEEEYGKASKCDSIQRFIDGSFGGVEFAKRAILADFFKHAFDGSGASNSFDAGSCIDGRLTSAWNWCSKIEKKSYFPLFLLTGFVGFDGQQGF